MEHDICIVLLITACFVMWEGLAGGGLGVSAIGAPTLSVKGCTLSVKEATIDRYKCASGADVTLTCSKPNANFVIKKGTTQVKSTIKIDDDTMTVTFKYSRLFVGEYKCLAYPGASVSKLINLENGVSAIDDKIDLHDSESTFEPLQLLTRGSLPGSTAHTMRPQKPRLTGPTSPVAIGGDLVLDCATDSVGVKTFDFYRDGTHLGGLSSSTSLYKKPMTTSDVGNYTCTATINGVTSAASEAVTVEELKIATHLAESNQSPEERETTRTTTILAPHRALNKPETQTSLLEKAGDGVVCGEITLTHAGVQSDPLGLADPSSLKSAGLWYRWVKIVKFTKITDLKLLRALAGNCEKPIYHGRPIRGYAIKNGGIQIDGGCEAVLKVCGSTPTTGLSPEMKVLVGIQLAGFVAALFGLLAMVIPMVFVFLWNIYQRSKRQKGGEIEQDEGENEDEQNEDEDDEGMRKVHWDIPKRLTKETKTGIASRTGSRASSVDEGKSSDSASTTFGSCVSSGASSVDED